VLHFFVDEPFNNIKRYKLGRVRCATITIDETDEQREEKTTLFERSLALLDAQVVDPADIIQCRKGRTEENHRPEASGVFADSKDGLPLRIEIYQSLNDHLASVSDCEPNGLEDLVG